MEETTKPIIPVQIFFLRCGDSGHDMFSFRGDYPVDNLKEIHCYVCKSFGYLCCVNSSSIGSKQVSCYNCGQSGHPGTERTNSCEGPGRIRSSIVCYACAEEGHFARRCSSHLKVDSTDAHSLIALAGDGLRISDLLWTAERLPSRARILLGVWPNSYFSWL